MSMSYQEFELRQQDLTKKFVKVRDALKNTGNVEAYIISYKKPWKFYREHTIKEAIEILKREV